MRLYAFDLPADPAMLSTWLEGHLMGLDLRQLVAELEALHGPAVAPAVALDDVLGTQRGFVLQQGLDGLSRIQLRQLLRQPRLLLEMQQLVLDEGGDYWLTLPAPPEIAAASADTWRQVEQAIRSTPVGRRRRYWPTLLTSLATAAVMLLGVFAYETWMRPVPAPLFAWTAPDAWPDGDGAVFFSYLADQVEQYWAAAPRGTDVQLAQRLGELREGCSVLLVQRPALLKKEDADWLQARCRRWAAKLDAQRLRLEAAGEEAADDVRAQVDTIVSDLATALRERANASRRAASVSDGLLETVAYASGSSRPRANVHAARLLTHEWETQSIA